MASLTFDLEFIKNKRQEKRLSIEEVSNLLGYNSYLAYYRKEVGDRKFSAEDIAVLSVLFDEPMKNFFKQVVTNSVT